MTICCSIKDSLVLGKQLNSQSIICIRTEKTCQISQKKLQGSDSEQQLKIENHIIDRQYCDHCTLRDQEKRLPASVGAIAAVKAAAACKNMSK